jgi:hypothetical protein
MEFLRRRTERREAQRLWREYRFRERRKEWDAIAQHIQSLHGNMSNEDMAASPFFRGWSRSRLTFIEYVKARLREAYLGIRYAD